MKKIINTWNAGLNYLLFDDLISYYAFFTTILAECCYLFAFCKQDLAMKLSAALIGYIFIVLLVARFKYSTNISNFDTAVRILFLISFILVFIVGCFVNWGLCLALTIIPIITAFTCMVLRDAQDSGSLFKKDRANKIAEVILLLITTGLPFSVFIAFLSMIPALSFELKIIIPVVYLLLAPFIAYIEDDWACNNIFELFLE